MLFETSLSPQNLLSPPIEIEYYATFTAKLTNTNKRLTLINDQKPKTVIDDFHKEVADQRKSSNYFHNHDH